MNKIGQIWQGGKGSHLTGRIFLLGPHVVEWGKVLFLSFSLPLNSCILFWEEGTCHRTHGDLGTILALSFHLYMSSEDGIQVIMLAYQAPLLSPHSLSILLSFLFSKSLILQWSYLLVVSIILVARSSIWIWHLGHNKIVQTTSSASSHFYLSTIASNTVLDLKVSEFLLPIVNRHTKVNF